MWDCSAIVFKQALEPQITLYQSKYSNWSAKGFIKRLFEKETINSESVHCNLSNSLIISVSESE